MQPLLRPSTLFSLICLTIITSLAAFVSPALLLDQNEKAALKRIATKLNKTDWDFSVDPCSGEGNWRNPETAKGLQSDVACDCSFSNSTKCHIISILLKGQNLSGTLPAEFGRFLHLQQLDLSRNLLTGTVPTEWKKIKLLGLSLMGNKLSGAFPIVLTNITTLTNLSIEGNDFNGHLPHELGKLVNMDKLVISANGFTGELPSALAKLTKLTDLRICSNNFSGDIPDFINRFTLLEKLHIQGCNLKGPIPSSISLLTSLTDLRISDLRGNVSQFPNLSEMKSLKTLVLRNCSIRGNIPPYIGNLDDLKHLDLSFNLLNGSIPSTFVNLQRVDFIYLTGNMLTGTIPGWVLKRNKNVDVSYNNFTFGNSGPTQCLQGSVNAVESYSPAVNTISSVSPCLKRHFPCSSSSNRYSLHLNCGGNAANINGAKFEPDLEQRGASTLYLSNSNWGFSSTGNFMDNDVDADSYIATNASALFMPNSELYTRARLSPISLTYFGLCMMKGSYTVKLHFAEIIFTNDSTFNSLGKRLFNVFIQDSLVLENFDIAEAAGGSGIAVIKTFNSSVTDSTLEIKLHWAGKGTTGIPYRGYYGPLISAISVTPNFRPPLDPRVRKKRVIIISGVVAALALISITLIIVLWRRQHIKNSMYRELRSLDLQTGVFTLRQIKAATKNFDPANKLGEGGFGSVYKGLLADGTVIAVKQLSSKSRQGNREFITELGVISALQHPNLVKLHGCCAEGNQLLLIYEYMENNSLAHILFSKYPQLKLKLDWATRRKICLDVAKGLAYLHEESILKIVHRDIKGSNILLDKDLNAKISDFGLAKLDEQDHTHISTRVAGTIGYMAPEYAMRGHLTYKADIYSFGVVALEIVSGKSNTNYVPKDDFVYLLDWACVLHQRGSLLELVDPDLGSDYSKEEALVVLKVALLCTNSSPTLRPIMSDVVKLLEGKASLQPLLSNLDVSAHSLSSDGIRRNFWQNPIDSQMMSIPTQSLAQSDPTSELLLNPNRGD